MADARERLRLVLMPHEADVHEVEQGLASVIAELKANGAPPETAVIAIKRLLDSRATKVNGPWTQLVFELAKENNDLYDAIVRLAIAKYYEAETQVPGP